MTSDSASKPKNSNHLGQVTIKTEIKLYFFREGFPAIYFLNVYMLRKLCIFSNCLLLLVLFSYFCKYFSKWCIPFIELDLIIFLKTLQM